MGLSISETLIIGFDMADKTVSDDLPVLTIGKHTGTIMQYMNTVRGDEAVALYEKLTNKKIKR